MFSLFPRLEERRRQAAGTMSGGERQMVAMAARADARPAILLLDEPSAGLAPAFVDAIFEKVREINGLGRDDPDGRAEREAGAGDVPPRLRPRPGTNRFHRTRQELIADPKVADLYLGGGDGRVDAHAGRPPPAPRPEMRRAPGLAGRRPSAL